METVNNYIKNVASKLATVMIDGDSREWPPSCSFFVYQPMRPQAKRSEDESSLPKDQK